MTTDDAFKEMIFTQKIYQKLGISPGRVRNIRSEFIHNDGVSLGMKIELLKKAGFLFVPKGSYFVFYDLTHHNNSSELVLSRLHTQGNY